MAYPENFQGFMIHSQENWSKFTKTDFRPKTLGERDIDVEIEACGVCGSDVHTITGGWGKCNLPLCVGHEIIGKVVQVGPKVTLVKLGQRVGVGAQVFSCLECQNCKSDNENYCLKQVDTYNARYADGYISQGGYASHTRVHEYFAFPIPDSVPSALAAPMLCAGITTYSPLVRAKVGPGKKVAVVGIGGLGHFGIMFANALGAETYAISHSPHKQEDAFKLGAKHFILTEESTWHEKYAFTFDFILNTADATHSFDMKAYMSTLVVNGTFHNVGLPDAPLPSMMVFDYMRGGYQMGASHIGSRPEMLAMLELAAKQQLHSWVDTIDISEDGCRQAVERVKRNDAKYRIVLVGYDKAFGPVERGGEKFQDSR